MIINSGIFLSVKDLMRLTGGRSYSSGAHQHKVIRDSLSSKKKKNDTRILFI